jgi:hypothetical protein
VLREREALLRQAQALEKDAFYSSKGHYRAAARYDRIAFLLGCMTIGLSSAAGLIQAFQARSSPATVLEVLSTVLSFVVAAVAAVTTFAKLSDRGSAHRASGVRFGRLRDHVRVFYETALPRAADLDGVRARIQAWVDEKSDLNEDSLHIPAWAYASARRERPLRDFESAQLASSDLLAGAEVADAPEPVRSAAR